MHAPSEHQIDGYNYDLELHIVHKYKDTEGCLACGDFGAVIGIMFDRQKGGNYHNFFLE